jgi:nitrogenase subunit NifH
MWLTTHVNKMWVEPPALALYRAKATTHSIRGIKMDKMQELADLIILTAQKADEILREYPDFYELEIAMIHIMKAENALQAPGPEKDRMEELTKEYEQRFNEFNELVRNKSN